MALALGIDVGVRKGLDAVLLDADSPIPIKTQQRLAVEELPALLAEWRPDVVAIDSPPAFASRGEMRETERALRRLGIQSYATPWDPHKWEIEFYNWMRTGFRTFKAAEAAGYPRYKAGEVRGTAIEVFPHATAVVLAGTLGPTGRAKHAWRRSILQAQGVYAASLHSNDQVDAALAALSGLLALKGGFTAPGDPEEGLIIVPVSKLPEEPYASFGDRVRRGTLGSVR